MKKQEAIPLASRRLRAGYGAERVLTRNLTMDGGRFRRTRRNACAKAVWLRAHRSWRSVMRSRSVRKQKATVGAGHERES